jgi:hypothetical protein
MLYTILIRTLTLYRRIDSEPYLDQNVQNFRNFNLYQQAQLELRQRQFVINNENLENIQTIKPNLINLNTIFELGSNHLVLTSIGLGALGFFLIYNFGLKENETLTSVDLFN